MKLTNQFFIQLTEMARKQIRIFADNIKITKTKNWHQTNINNIQQQQQYVICMMHVRVFGNRFSSLNAQS